MHSGRVSYSKKVHQLWLNIDFVCDRCANLSSSFDKIVVIL